MIARSGTTAARGRGLAAGHHDMHNLTPFSGLIGGALIGLATSLLMLLTGRIAGISGIFGGLLARNGGDAGWRIAFIAGLIAAPLLAALAGRPLPMPAMPASLIVIAIGGLLVGVGTRMGSGCTSGHGVCGTARLSARSLAATAIFMIAAIVTVAVVRHGLGG
jgi:uncharacterized membrane protein YedE/YeeE